MTPGQFLVQAKVYTHISDRVHKSHFMLGQPEIDWSSLLLAQTSGVEEKEKRNKSKKNRQDGWKTDKMGEKQIEEKQRRKNNKELIKEE